MVRSASGTVAGVPTNESAVLQMAEKTHRLPAELWTVEQVADYLHFGRAAIWQQRHRGKAPGNLGMEAAGRILFDTALIAQWLAEGWKPDWTPNGK